MLVSVIIPAYNRQHTVRRAVDSVLAQTYSPIEIIVVDDGSSDRTVELLQLYGSQIRLIQQPNQGPSVARNTGIRAATGQIIAFLDSDDEWLPTKVARQMPFFLKDGGTRISCVVCNAKMQYTDGSVRHSFEAASLTPGRPSGVWINPAQILATRFLLFNQVLAVRREALDQAGYFPEDLRILEDYDLALRLSVIGAWGFIADPLVIWHGGAANSLSNSVGSADVTVRAYQVLSRFCNSPLGARVKDEPCMQSRLRLLCYRSKANAMVTRSNWFSRVSGKAWLALLKIYDYVYRRSPKYPKIETSALELAGK